MGDVVEIGIKSKNIKEEILTDKIDAEGQISELSTRVKEQFEKLLNGKINPGDLNAYNQILDIRRGLKTFIFQYYGFIETDVVLSPEGGLDVLKTGYESATKDLFRIIDHSRYESVFNKEIEGLVSQFNSFLEQEISQKNNEEELIDFLILLFSEDLHLGEVVELSKANLDYIVGFFEFEFDKFINSLNINNSFLKKKKISEFDVLLVLKKLGYNI